MRNYEAESADSPEVDETRETEKQSTRPEHFSSTYTLKPNEEYDSNQYHYETDSRGRITRCEGTLRLEDGKRNTDHQTRAGGPDRLESDQGGHLIARRFGGSEKIDNLVPMDKDLNNGEYKELENDWEKALERGDTVDVQIRCRYSGDSQRPDSFVVKYKITDENGFSRYETKVLKNGKNGG